MSSHLDARASTPFFPNNSPVTLSLALLSRPCHRVRVRAILSLLLCLGILFSSRHSPTFVNLNNLDNHHIVPRPPANTPLPVFRQRAVRSRPWRFFSSPRSTRTVRLPVATAAQALRGPSRTPRGAQSPETTRTQHCSARRQREACILSTTTPIPLARTRAKSKATAAAQEALIRPSRVICL